MNAESGMGNIPNRLRRSTGSGFGAVGFGAVGFGIADFGDLQAETGFLATEEKDWVVKKLG